MAQKSDTRIHQIELLLTLDYLLNYTDKEHPATQQAICAHARDFGLKYDPKAKQGNDVRRQRIGDCLEFLQHISYKYENKIPFTINTTDSHKFYIEEKNHLDDIQIIKVLAAVINDKYTQDEDTKLLTEKLLDTLANKYNREKIIDEVAKVNKGVKKYNSSTNRKIRLVNKAYKENKMIDILFTVCDEKGIKEFNYIFHYRVYKIIEFKGVPYALLIPIYTGNFVKFRNNYIFDRIENLNIPKGSDKSVLCDDDDRDLNDWFIKKVKPTLSVKCSSIDEFIQKNIIPISGKAVKVSFYFRKYFLKFIKPSFEEFFSTNLDYVGCNSFDIIDEKEVNLLNDKFYIEPHPLKSNEDFEYYVVNTIINLDAFMSWLIGDLHNDGKVTFSDIIAIVGPYNVNKYLYEYYLKHAKRLQKHLKQEDVDKAHKHIESFK